MSAKNFHSPCERRFRQRRFHNFIRKFFVVVPVAMQNSLVIRDGSLEVVRNVRLVRIQSIRVVNLLIVDIHLNIGKKLGAKRCLHEKREELVPPPPPSLPHPLLPLLCAPFLLLCYLNFVTTTPDKFQFQSQVRLSQFNVIVPIRLNFKLDAVFIE